MGAEAEAEANRHAASVLASNLPQAPCQISLKQALYSHTHITGCLLMMHKSTRPPRVTHDLACQVIMEAEPGMWQTGAVRNRIAEMAGVKRLPFLRVKLHYACLDLATLAQSAATYINITTQKASCDDLRLAYCNVMKEFHEDDEADVGQEGAGDPWDGPPLQACHDQTMLHAHRHARLTCCKLSHI